MNGVKEEVRKKQDRLALYLGEAMSDPGSCDLALPGANPEIPQLAVLYRGQAFLVDPDNGQHRAVIDLIRQIHFSE